MLLAWIVGRPVRGIVPRFCGIFEGIGEEAQGNCFDCFLHFWHVFWRFIEEWAGGTIENKSDG
jgi:hypothetical protein